MPMVSSGCISGATKAATLAKLEPLLCTCTAGAAAGPVVTSRSRASEATMATKRLRAPPPSDSPRMSWIFW